MARVRSPNYPAIGLPEAIDRLKQLFGKAQNRPISREQAAEAMGFDGLHGGSMGAISALLKFGLLDKQNGQVKVSERGMAIVAPQDDEERLKAINEAAIAFPLFKELQDRFLGEIPNDEKLRSYLLRKSFASSALDRVVRSYRETMDLVSEGDKGYIPTQPKSEGVGMAQEVDLAGGVQPMKSPSKGIRGAPFRVAWEGDAIEISGRLTTPEEIDKLIKFLELNKVLIAPVRGAFSTEYTDDGKGRQAEERDRKLIEESSDK